jgi:hypothetical protein
MARITAIIDGHVHIHACYDIDEFFDSAYRNLSRAAGGPDHTGLPTRFVLCLTECAGDDYFGDLRARAGEQGTTRMASPRRWTVARTQESESLVLRSADRRLFLIAGRQVACREGLEVLLLGTQTCPRDGQPIAELLAQAERLEAPHVIPWGAGKWFFGRGRLLSRLLREHRSPLFFLGDEGGRPAFWPYPRHFKEAAECGVRDLPGTDPLPFRGDLGKVGRVGFQLVLDFDEAHPASSLRRALKQQDVRLERFARLEPPWRFMRNQFAMQLRKRHAT